MAEGLQTPAIGRRRAVWTNLLPVFGVWAFDWSMASALFFFWLESVLVGLQHAVCMACMEAPDYPRLAKVGLTALFTLHYGAFCLIYGAMVYGLTEPERLGTPTLYVSIAVLLALRGVDLVTAMRTDPNWRAGDLFQVMFQPYGRILLLHGGLLLGAVLCLVFAWPVGLLVLLFGLKALAEILVDRDPNAWLRV